VTTLASSTIAQRRAPSLPTGDRRHETRAQGGESSRLATGDVSGRISAETARDAGRMYSEAARRRSRCSSGPLTHDRIELGVAGQRQRSAPVPSSAGRQLLDVVDSLSPASSGACRTRLYSPIMPPRVQRLWSHGWVGRTSVCAAPPDAKRVGTTLAGRAKRDPVDLGIRFMYFEIEDDRRRCH
jgi:hypothetical protein